MEVLPDYQGIFRQKWGWKSMSYAVVRMQKMKSHDLKGIQFHNQRERDSQTNDDIDKSKSHENYDLVNAEKIDYNERVKNIIDLQKTGTRKTRKDAVLVNELLVTSDQAFFEGLAPAEQRRFFEESYKILAERYGEQNMAYAMVHHDEKTPHLHVGVVPMRDGKLQGKNVFNRQELLWLQDEFPKQMSRLGFEWVRGEKGSDRAHMETAKFKKHTLAKANALVEKELAAKKNELLALNREVPTDIEVRAKKQMKNTAVPTGEKTVFGHEKMQQVKVPTGNVIVPEADFRLLVKAAKENQRLKGNVEMYLQTDLAKENGKLHTMLATAKREKQALQREITQITEEKQALDEENGRLKGQIADLRREIALVYENMKAFVKERTNDCRGVLRTFADKVKDKLPKSQFGRLQDADERQENEKHMAEEIERQHVAKKKLKSSSRGMEL